MSTHEAFHAPDVRSLIPSADELYEEAPCGYLTTLPDGTILKANRTFLRWMQLPGEALQGRRFQTLLTLPGQIYHDTHFGPLLRMQGAVAEVAFDIVKGDGSRLAALVNAVQRTDETGAPSINLLTVFNATDRRRYEQELLAARREATRAAEELARLNRELEQRVAAEVGDRLRAEDALRQAQKMEAIGQLTGGVAHDFNNLLTIIIGNLDSQKRQLDAMPETAETRRLRRLRDMAHEGAQRAATLTSRLLAFARRQALDPRPLNPNGLVQGLHELLRRTLGETITLDVVLAEDVWNIEADPNELERTLLNLIVNARDAMADGGKLVIRTANIVVEDGGVEGTGEPAPPGAYVMIAVSDTGCGMSAETRERAFEPFFTTKPVGRGTGLGMSQVYGFVRQSGGYVGIESELGRGTTVSLYLPKVEDVAPVPVAQARPAEDCPGGDETILLVEDHEALRQFAREVLTELGYSVVEAADGPSALELLQRRPGIDLLFTDIVLPGVMNGRELADAARRLVPNLRTLFTTGYAGDVITRGGRLDPALTVISKPFTYESLARKVREVLDGGA